MLAMVLHQHSVRQGLETNLIALGDLEYLSKLDVQQTWPHGEKEQETRA